MTGFQFSSHQHATAAAKELTNQMSRTVILSPVNALARVVDSLADNATDAKLVSTDSPDVSHVIVMDTQSIVIKILECASTVEIILLEIIATGNIENCG